MKMFLTRLGFDSKAVITGDMTQSDLPEGKPIGLLQAQDLLKDIEGIKFIYFTGFDVVRHALVQRIMAYRRVSYVAEQRRPSFAMHAEALGWTVPRPATSWGFDGTV